MTLPLIGDLPYGATPEHRADMERLEVILEGFDGRLQTIDLPKAVRVGYLQCNVQATGAEDRWVLLHSPSKGSGFPVVRSLYLAKKTSIEERSPVLDAEEIERLREKRKGWDKPTTFYRP